MLKYLYIIAEKLSSLIKVYEPGSIYLTIWDFYHSIIILFSIYYIPVEWCMGLNFG